tara:strand:+ start:543 stop:1310 length:768 start_codon:yes stop_codon:yes gene_type:complete
VFGENPVRKQELSDGSTLWIQEIFPTIQGEGIEAGNPAIFVRVAGCNLKCFFCDTDFESSDWHPTVSEIIETIAAKREASNASLVVLTGGEPFRQNVIPLVRAINHELKMRVQIETSGTLIVPEIRYCFLDWFSKDSVARRLELRARRKFDNTIVVSPKTPRINEQLIPYIDAYKYIVRTGDIDHRDGLPCKSTQIEGNVAKIARPHRSDIPIFIQPCDEYDEEKNKENMKLAGEICMQYGYRLSLQMHKAIGLP